MTALRPFQNRFIRAATAPGIDTAIWSAPRGNGKSWLAGHLASRIMDPSDPLFRPDTESVLCAASIEQARIVFRFARSELEPRGGYRFLDSHTRIGIVHVATNTRLRVIGSNGRTAMGLVACPWVIADEPGAWETIGGQLVYDAIETAKGKPGSPLRVVYIGTLAPAVGGWWHDLVADGSGASTYVQVLQGDPDKWDQWGDIQRCNPLTAISADFRRKLLEERDAARRDSRFKARFLSYRLNVPTGDQSTMLLTVDDWERMAARPVPPREGRPIVGVDLGGGRAWPAAVACWRNGRVEALAVAPGIPSLDEQERRDRVPKGTYRALAAKGGLRIAEGACGCNRHRNCGGGRPGHVGPTWERDMRPLPIGRSTGLREPDAGCAARVAVERSGFRYPVPAQASGGRAADRRGAVPAVAGSFIVRGTGQA